ncbi:hypothetical protein HDU96_000085 [Phlyctochytrium bullatum]|nr:hypothetical protein HDU96_000085 [Phlyctochytrium bullatum]
MHGARRTTSSASHSGTLVPPTPTPPRCCTLPPFHPKRRRICLQHSLLVLLVTTLVLLKLGWYPPYQDAGVSADGVGGGTAAEEQIVVLRNGKGRARVKEGGRLKKEEKERVVEDGVCGDLAGLGIGRWGVGVGWECGRVPRIIHQMEWGGEGGEAKVGPRLAATRRSWTTNHPTYHYHLWTEPEALSNLTLHYPHLLPTFDVLPLPIDATNPPGTHTRRLALSFLLMHRFGGIYASSGMESLRPLTSLIEPRWKPQPGRHPSGGGAALVAGTFHPTHLETSDELSDGIPALLLASVPGHPFWMLAVEGLRGLVERVARGKGGRDWAYLDAVVGANRWLHNVYSVYVNRTAGMVGAPEVVVLSPASIYPLDLTNKNVDPICRFDDAAFDSEACKKAHAKQAAGAYTFNYWSSLQTHAMTYKKASRREQLYYLMAQA